MKKSELVTIIKEEISNAITEKGGVEEIFGLGKKDGGDQRKKMSDGIVASVTKTIEDFKKKGKNIPIPAWGKPGTPEHEKAIDAAIKYKTAEIYYNPNKKEFLPRKFAAKGHSFGGGSDGVTLENQDSKKN